MSDQQNVSAHSWGEFKKQARNAVYKAVIAGVISGVLAAAVAIWGIIQKWPGMLGLVPSGAVAAFALESKCPAGWGRYDEASGRFVIGAVSGRDLDSIPRKYGEDDGGAKLGERKYGEPGGEQRVTLQPGQMPKHRHSPPPGYYHWWYKGGGNGTHRITDDTSPQPVEGWFAVPATTTDLLPTEEGNNESHNNMPPYVALYFCKKD